MLAIYLARPPLFSRRINALFRSITGAFHARPAGGPAGGGHDMNAQYII